MRVLTLTTLYPNQAAPSHGVFVENRLREVSKDEEIDLKVIAPVPWFPFKADLFGSYASFAKAPQVETRHGIEVSHPRYFLPPRMGMTYAAKSLARCFEREAIKLIGNGWDFDLIDAHYYYPDGVAAVDVGEKLNKPVVVTARGTDINLIPEYPKQREMILGAAASASASITVCQALKDEMVRLGAFEDKITVLRNGIDLDTFRPLDRDEIRKEMELDGPVLLSVGHLIERKGHDLVIRLLSEIQDATLLIAGAGPEENSLKKLASSLGLESRVRFSGHIAHENLPALYNAADLLVLASSREGWPNVLLEAMACGTSTVATPVWGSGEVITTPEAGKLAEDRSVKALHKSVTELLSDLPDRAKTRAFAERYSWTETAEGVRYLFHKVISSNVDKPSLTNTNWKVDSPLQLKGQQPRLLVTIDTEEIFDWENDGFDKHQVAHPKDIARFQELCEKYNCKPLYFITWPLMKDAITAMYFKKLHDESKADLGIHLHQWVTPPHDQENTPYTSYQCNLPRKLHQAKLAELTRAFEETFGFFPVSHRAGRYGVSPQIHQDLLEAGIIYDFSPNAGGDQSAVGGPDFSGITSRGWIRKSPADKQQLTCLPVSGGRSWRRTDILLPQPAMTSGQCKQLSSIIKKLTALRRLSPEGFNVKDLTSLTESLLKQEISLLTYSLHSTSLTCGATPYGKSPSDVDNLLSSTDTYFNWFTNEKGGAFATLSDIADAVRVNSVSD